MFFFVSIWSDSLMTLLFRKWVLKLLEIFQFQIFHKTKEIFFFICFRSHCSTHPSSIGVIFLFPFSACSSFTIMITLKGQKSSYIYTSISKEKSQYNKIVSPWNVQRFACHSATSKNNKNLYALHFSFVQLLNDGSANLNTVFTKIQLFAEWFSHNIPVLIKQLFHSISDWKQKKK